MMFRVAIPALLGLLGLGAGMLLMSVAELRDSESVSLQQQAEATAEALAIGVGPALASQDLPLANTTIDHLFDESRHAALRVNGAAGELITERVSDATMSGGPGWFMRLYRSAVASATTSVGASGESLTVVMQQGQAGARVWKHFLQLLLWGGLITGLTLMLLWVTLRNALRPLARARQVARGIVDGVYVDGEVRAAGAGIINGVVTDVSRASWHVSQLHNEWQESTQLLEEQGAIDPVTGLLNRRATDEKLQTLATPGVVGVIEFDDVETWRRSEGSRPVEERLAHVAGELRTALAGDEVWAGRLDAGRIMFGRGKLPANRSPALSQSVQAVLEENGELAGHVSVAVLTLDQATTRADVTARLDQLIAKARRSRASGQRVGLVTAEAAHTAGAPIGSPAEAVQQAIAENIAISFRPVIDLQSNEIMNLAEPAVTLDGTQLRYGPLMRECARFDLSLELDRGMVAGLADTIGGVEETFVNPLALPVTAAGFVSASFRAALAELAESVRGRCRLTVEVHEMIFASLDAERFTSIADELRDVGIGVAVHSVATEGSLIWLYGCAPDYIVLGAEHGRHMGAADAVVDYVSDIVKAASRRGIPVYLAGIRDRAGWERAVGTGIKGGRGEYPGLPTSTRPATS